MELHVMTFNIRHGKGTDGKVDLPRIAAVIEQSSADVVGLNEVDRYFSRRSGYEDQIGWLAKELRMHHAFSPSVSLGANQLGIARQYGNGLLSRYPIATHQSHSLNMGLKMAEGRSLLEAIIDVQGQPFAVYVTHLSLNPFLHRRQTDFIIGQLDRQPFPSLIMGDWNMRPGSKPWNKMTRKMDDVWQKAGTGNGDTYPSFRPRRRLDYIFISRQLHAIDAQVVAIRPTASDHLPLRATLRLD
ncbi:endonuclease/exonuclease/phosphatase family protein [Geobacillus subterraneus]|uniref:endonuclease/exonuclease/phosphatase family protein n=1 Tax=Geobacillus subterraneus TaxID=129338 RepID=UPI001442BB07|nr:endonuclease/exonuclease/phosphatase family protein [Geobacillus subterraneus]QIZ67753.1 endonuclease [Geobacillus subterraneus]WPZ19962.1 endonuclease/exonuclease/phosphatase family protein [Geobacillus subterraneus]